MMNTKIILSGLLLIGICNAFAQSYSTGEITLSSTNNYTAEIDVDQTQVTLTLKGPNNRWLGLGFGETCMINNGDVVMFNGTTLSDRQFVGVGVLPALDTNQDWSIQSNTESGGIRTLVATRSLETGNDNDFIFPTEEVPITLVWAVGQLDGNDFESHGGSRGSTMSSFVLNIKDLFASEFTMSPNPTSNFVQIELPRSINKGEISIIDYTGKTVSTTPIERFNKSLDISSLQTGIYLVNFDTPQGTIAKKLMKL